MRGDLKLASGLIVTAIIIATGQLLGTGCSSSGALASGDAGSDAPTGNGEGDASTAAADGGTGGTGGVSVTGTGGAFSEGGTGGRGSACHPGWAPIPLPTITSPMWPDPPRRYGIGANLEHLAAGDVNGDGWTDLVTASVDVCGVVRVLLNTGDGTFAGPIQYPAGNYVRWVTLGDLNGDARADIVAVTTETGAALTILFSRADGTFDPPVVLEQRYFGRALIRDLDGDGDNDLAAPYSSWIANGGFSGGLKIWLNQGGGTFSQPSIQGGGVGMGALAADDLDGDGKVDVAATLAGTDAVAVLVNAGDGSYSPPRTVATSIPIGAGGTGGATGAGGAPGASGIGPAPAAIATGDVDGDGDADLIVGKFRPNWPDPELAGSILVLRNQGGGVFDAPSVYPVPATPGGLAVADVDGDGRSDVIVTRVRGSWSNPDRTANVRVLRGRMDGALEPPIDYRSGAGPVAVVAADLDGDGRVDLATANRHSEDVSVLRNSGGGAFGSLQFPIGATGRLALADLDKDGAVDLAFTRSSPDGRRQLAVSINDGRGTFQPPTAARDLVDFAADLTLADADGDGRMDALVSQPNQSVIKILWGDGAGAFDAETGISAAFGGGTILAGRLNRDARPDLLFIDDARLRVRLATGSRTFGSPTTVFEPGDWYGYALMDLDGDGTEDLISSSRPGQVDLHLNRGDGTFSPPIVIPGIFGPLAQDLNGDGRADLVAADMSGGVRVMLNDGGGTFRTRGVYPLGAVPLRILLGDLNGDARKDVVALVASDPGRVAMLFDLGGGALSEAVTHDLMLPVGDLALRDVNADGRADLVLQSDDVTVLLNRFAR